ncbi:MAG: folylpolyglutamate synthase/dihydrofolate synthase family protein [Acidobacteriota bacterium]
MTELPREAAKALDRLELFGIRLGLDRMADLLAALGDPQRRFPAVLVAGTNGKGSTAALLASMATAAGYRTGLYTSPHLESVTERVRIDGRPIDGETLGALLLRAIEATPEAPTYFEALTAAAFAHFAECTVDLGVVEVGLGGRLDATNLAQPVLSLITPISFDHREHLGDTLAAIAGEKAGILRAGRPAIAWVKQPEAAAALSERARGIGAELTFGKDVAPAVASQPKKDFWSGQQVTIVLPDSSLTLEIPLLGDHQAENLALAAVAAGKLQDIGWDRLDGAAIARGAAAVEWPGRLEVLRAGDRQRVLLDAAHNADGAERLARFLAQAPTGRLDLLLGLLKDKEAAAIVPPLAARVAERGGRTLLTRPPHERGRDPRELLPWVGSAPALATVHSDWESALGRALEGAGDTLLVAGSFFLVGAARGRLR